MPGTSLITMSLVAVFLLAAACDTKKAAALCGNGILDPGETCDGTNLDGKTCYLVVPTRAGGNLACSASCTFDTIGCTAVDCDGQRRDGSEECDGNDLDGKTCADFPYFKGGTLSCTTGCIFDFSLCELDCNVTENFAPCDPMGGTDECCQLNGWPSTCLSRGDVHACLQTCSAHADCGWSLECDTEIDHVCTHAFCGAGMERNGVQVPCVLADNRPGVCLSQERAMDDWGFCLESGTIRHGDSCPLDDATGRLGVDPATRCENGFCVGPAGATEGRCMNKCNPLGVLSTGVDPCPASSACLNLSSLDLDPTLEDGSPNPHYLFRQPDLGLCTLYEPGAELTTCDLRTGNVLSGLSPGQPCPVGQTCSLSGLGSLLGVCADVSMTPLGEGEPCEIVPDAPEPCDAGLQCTLSDPFQDNSGGNLACRRFCEATVYEANPACAGLSELRNPYMCLSVSRFHTADRELPTAGSGLDLVTETSPSPLGFCVPPPAN